MPKVCDERTICATVPNGPRYWRALYTKTESQQALVCGISGFTAALKMPPVVMAAIMEIYGEGGHPCRRTGAGAWIMEGYEVSTEYKPIRTAATPRSGSGGSAGLASKGCARAGRACAKAQWRDCYRERACRVRFYVRPRNAPEGLRRLISETVVTFDRPKNMAGWITAAEAAALTGFTEKQVINALRTAIGGDPDPAERFNGIALRAFLVDFCRRRKNACRRTDPNRAKWEQRQKAVERCDQKGFVIGG